MTVSLQVLYPVTKATSFDHDYYATTHMALVGEHMGPHLTSTHVVKGLAAGGEAPAGFYAIATMNFADEAAMQAALAAGGPVLADISNYYNGQPEILVGTVIG